MSALKGHPKGLYLIFATSTAERFSYYGMRAIFILFLTQALLFDKEAAASIYGSYTGLVYLTPLIGGYMTFPACRISSSDGDSFRMGCGDDGRRAVPDVYECFHIE